MDSTTKQVMISTIDNPFNYFSDFDRWLEFDTSHGYYSLQYLARIANASYEMSDAQYEAEIRKAIDEILKFNVTGMYVKIEEDTKK